MKLDNKELARMRELCAELGHDDGQDTRRSRRGGNRKKDDRKRKQLCGQVARTVGVSLSTSQEDSLCGLYVVAVTPTDINGRLRVWVAAHDPAISPAQALARLQAARSWLRSEVAAAISRRRVPDLTFEWYLPEVTP